MIELLSLQIQKVNITCMRHQDRCRSKTKSNMFLYCFCKSSTDKGYTNVSTSKQDSCIYIFNPICMLFFFLQKTDAPLEQVMHCIESVCKEEEVFTFLKADDNLLSVPLDMVQDVSWDRGPIFRNQIIGSMFTYFYFTRYLWRQ